MNQLSPWRVKEIDPDRLAYVVPDDGIRTNAGKMSCVGTITTDSLDLDRDRILTKGIDLTQHRRNPVVLLAHNRDCAIGKAEDRMGAYTVKMIGDNRLEAETFFGKNTLGEECFRLVEEKVLRGLSIGFPRSSAVIEKGYDSSGGQIQVYAACQLLEYSILPLPSNPDCLVSRVEKGFGGKGKLCPELDALLRPLVPEKKAMVTSGFVGVAKMYEDDTMQGVAGRDDLQPEAPPEVMEPAVDAVTPDAPVEGDGLKAGAQFAHALHDRLTDMIGFTEEAMSSQEHAGLIKAAKKVQAGLAKLMETIQSAYGDYLGEHGDMPALPDAPAVEGEDAEVDDVEDEDVDVGDEEPDADAKDDVEKKRLRHFLTKAKAWWRYRKEKMRLELSADSLKRVEKIEKALAALESERDPARIRRVTKGLRREFGKVQLTGAGEVAPAVDTEDAIAAAIAAAIAPHQQALAGVRAALPA